MMEKLYNRGVKYVMNRNGYNIIAAFESNGRKMLIIRMSEALVLNPASYQMSFYLSCVSDILKAKKKDCVLIKMVIYRRLACALLDV